MRDLRTDSESFEQLVAEFDKFQNGCVGQLTHLIEPGSHRFKEREQFREALMGEGITLTFLCFGDAFTEQGQGGIELPSFAFVQDDSEKFPNVLYRFEMV